MNSYYHSFTPNILGSVWFYVGIAWVVVMVILGVKMWYIGEVRHRPKIKKRYDENLVFCISVILMVVLCVLVYVENNDGVIQMLNSSLAPADSLVLPLFLFLIVTMVAGLFGCFGLVGVFLLASTLKRKHLEKKIDQYTPPKKKL